MDTIGIKVFCFAQRVNNPHPSLYSSVILTYLLTYVLPGGYLGTHLVTRSGTRVTNYPITAALTTTTGRYYSYLQVSPTGCRQRIHYKQYKVACKHGHGLSLVPIAPTAGRPGRVDIASGCGSSSSNRSSSTGCGKKK